MMDLYLDGGLYNFTVILAFTFIAIWLAHLCKLGVHLADLRSTGMLENVLFIPQTLLSRHRQPFADTPFVQEQIRDLIRNRSETSSEHLLRVKVDVYVPRNSVVLNFDDEKEQLVLKFNVSHSARSKSFKIFWGVPRSHLRISLGRFPNSLYPNVSSPEEVNGNEEDEVQTDDERNEGDIHAPEMPFWRRVLGLHGNTSHILLVDEEEGAEMEDYPSSSTAIISAEEKDGVMCLDASEWTSLDSAADEVEVRLTNSAAYNKMVPFKDFFCILVVREDSQEENDNGRSVRNDEECDEEVVHVETRSVAEANVVEMKPKTGVVGQYFVVRRENGAKMYHQLEVFGYDEISWDLLAKRSTNNGDDSEGNFETGDGDDDDEEGDSLCVVCLATPKSVMLYPCRHLCACMECCKHLVSCPVCRADAEAFIEFKMTNSEDSSSANIETVEEE